MSFKKINYSVDEMNELFSKVERLDEMPKNEDGGKIVTTINVLEQGCVADGVTDNLSKLKEIFGAVANDTVIYFPAGDYMIGNGDETQTLLTLSGLDNVKITGDEDGISKLILHGNTPVGINYGILELYQCTNCTIRNLELDGNVQARYLAHGSLWDDLATNYKKMSNIEIQSGENILIENINSHHPAMDCIFIGRYAGGDTPNGKNAIIRNCILEYGYRQGISIVGWDNGLIQDCVIGETGLAANPKETLEEGDPVTLGTSPMAGIDSETWSTNYDWVIEKCIFNNNYLDINDGSIRFNIRDNIFNNSNFYSSTPSAGARTFDICVKNNFFKDSVVDIYNKGFVFEENTFKIKSGTNHQFKFVHDPENIWYADGAGTIEFRNNVVMIIEGDDGKIVPRTNICFAYFSGEMVMDNNVFINCFFNTFTNADGTFGIFKNNVFKMNISGKYDLNNAKQLIQGNHFVCEGEGNFFYIGNENVKVSSDPSVGVMGFDEKSGKPIWWNGSAWVDAAGNAI